MLPCNQGYKCGLGQTRVFTPFRAGHKGAYTPANFGLTRMLPVLLRPEPAFLSSCRRFYSKTPPEYRRMTYTGAFRSLPLHPVAKKPPCVPPPFCTFSRSAAPPLFLNAQVQHFFPNQLVNHPARRFLPADLHKAFKVERRLRRDPDRHFPRFLSLLLHALKTSVLLRCSP